MSVTVILSLISQISVFLKAVPALIGTVVSICGKAAQYLTAVEPYIAKFFPKLAGFVAETVAALTYVSVHGADAVAEAEHVINLLLELDPTKPAPAKPASTG